MCQLLLFPIRFIPADAGNSSVISSIAELNAVYPRWRGELLHSIVIMRIVIGLSPLARGTHCPGNVPPVVIRFIPAGAGNSSPRVNQEIKCSVYPRWRGELYLLHRCGAIKSGLSPLARGTLPRRNARNSPGRFIPAGAGNSAPAYRSDGALPVYPRWRGELAAGIGDGLSGHGLSPLARGTH